MSRKIHALISEEAQARLSDFHQPLIEQLQQEIHSHDIVVVGLAYQPSTQRVIKELNKLDCLTQCIEISPWIGSSEKRLAIKIWSGWPSFPQIFVRGMLIGGELELGNFVASGDFNRRMTPIKQAGK